MVNAPAERVAICINARQPRATGLGALVFLRTTRLNNLVASLKHLFQVRRGKGEIGSLTGMRGIAATFVMLFHFGLLFQKPPLAGWQIALNRSPLWVDFFFILSGFVMGLKYEGFNEWRIDHFTTFLQHRIARVWPLYIITTLLLMPVEKLWREDVNPHGLSVRLLANFFMVQNWGFGVSINRNTWSISTEWLAYVMFPFLFWSAMRSATRATATAILVAVLIVWMATDPASFLATSYVTTDGYSPEPLVRCVCEFTLGLLVFRVSRTSSGIAFATAGWPATLLLCLLIVAFCATSSSLLVVALMPPLVLALAADKGFAASLLGSQPILWLGRMSYAIYLIHPVFTSIYWHFLWRFQARGIEWLSPVVAVIGIVATLLAAPLLWALVEEPSNRVLRGGIRQREMRVEAPTI